MIPVTKSSVSRLNNKMLEKGWEGFEGGMTTKTSKATATMDLQQLQELGAFIPEGAGRAVHYHLSL